jgi:hypothetical protein
LLVRAVAAAADEPAAFAVLCDFLAGSSVDEVAREHRLSVAEAERLLRTALLSYGFKSGPRG